MVFNHLGQLEGYTSLYHAKQNNERKEKETCRDKYCRRQYPGQGSTIKISKK